MGKWRVVTFYVITFAGLRYRSVNCLRSGACVGGLAVVVVVAAHCLMTVRLVVIVVRL